MPMGTAPASGYVLPFTEDISKRLNINYGEHQKDIDLYIENGEDFESAIESIVQEETEIEIKATINGKTIPVWLIRYNRDDGDCYDGLTDGYYFAFDEDDLYERKLTPVGQALKDEGDLFPQYERWTVYG